jgi:hypothetical protein
VQYVAADGAATVLLSYQVHGLMGRGAERAQLRGLDAARRYRRESDGRESSGAVLMDGGLPLDFAGGAGSGLDYRSELQLWRTIER